MKPIPAGTGWKDANTGADELTYASWIKWRFVDYSTRVMATAEASRRRGDGEIGDLAQFQNFNINDDDDDG